MVNLFIYIPTFNRPKALNRQLESLVPQIRGREENVRVIVRDNCSESDSFRLLKEKYSNCKNISFEKNFSNIGGNANIALGFINVRKNEFLWILSDNDLINRDAIENLLRVLTLDIDFVVCNFEVLNPKIENWKWIDGWQTPMNWRMGLISDTLFNANTLYGSIDAAFYFHNSSFPHLAVACKAAMKKDLVKFILMPHYLVHQDILDSAEAPTDYSLAHTGMPLLLQLMPQKPGAQFARKWAKANAHFLYLNKSKYPAEFIASHHLLLQYGGFLIHWYLFIGYLGAKLYPIKRNLIKRIKKRVSSENQELLRKWGKYFL